MRDKIRRAPIARVGSDSTAVLEEIRLPEQPRAPSEREWNRPVHTTAELREFLTRNLGSFTGRAIRLCSGRLDQGEEIIQELYPRLLRMLERHQEGLRNPWAASHAIMARLSIDMIRRRSRHPEQFDETATLHDRRRTEPSVQFDHRQLDSALSTLPPRLQTIVLGIFIEGCSAKSVASRINLSESRLSELKTRALMLLRRALASEDFEL